MDDTQPLFGEESRHEKLFVAVGTFSSLGWVTYCVVIGVVMGILKGHISHLIFGAAILCLAALPYFLYRWYRNDDLEPKFRWLTLWSFLVLWLIGIVLNLYVWNDKVAPVPCPGGSQFVIFNSTGYPNCYPICPNDYCFDFISLQCINCTVCISPPSGSGNGSSSAYEFY